MSVPVLHRHWTAGGHCHWRTESEVVQAARHNIDRQRSITIFAMQFAAFTVSDVLLTLGGRPGAKVS